MNLLLLQKFPKVNIFIEIYFLRKNKNRYLRQSQCIVKEYYIETLKNRIGLKRKLPFEFDNTKYSFTNKGGQINDLPF